jgi:HEAT repeat protein
MSGDVEALPVLLEAIDSSDDETRKAAAQALGMIADPRAVPALLTALKDNNVAQEAAWSLGYIADPAGAPGLITALNYGDFGTRFAAAFALAGIQDATAVEPLKVLLKDKERRVQIAAACSLAFHSSDAGFDTLKTSLRSRSEDWYRFAAIVGLLRLNTPAAREVLAAAPPDPKFPQLQQLREAGLRDGATSALLTLLREGTDDQRHYAARVLPFFRDPVTVEPLRVAADDTNAEVRSAARVAAVQIERYATAKARQ